MSSSFHDGIPKISDYKAVLESKEFKEIENFSDAFIQLNKAILQKFPKWWAADALHSWSRQWEYPYVYDKITREIQDHTNVRILDAGSGITFFPYFLRNKWKNADIFCCDYNDTLSKLFKRINEKHAANVNFSAADLMKLPYNDEFFDIVYCISVLEHTTNYEIIIDEFRRVMKPGGLLVLTFDISLDGTLDISIDKATILVRLLTQRFQSKKMDIQSLISKPEIWTTVIAKKLNPRLLPWRIPLLTYIKNSVNNRRLVSWIPPITVFCLSLKRL